MSDSAPRERPTSTRFDLTGHVALVTGGNHGIGLGIARGLAEAGAEVCIWGTNAERNAAALAQLAGSVTSMQIDISDEAAVTAAMAELAGRHGRLDSCFANAGVAAARTPLIDTELARFRDVTRVNIEGSFLTLREAARHMIGAGNGGSLVGTSSLAARAGQAGGYAYAASKAAMLAMIKALAVELARYKIRANAILPGWIETSMTASTFANEKFVANVMPRIPARRWGDPDDFAALAVYLASPASAFHTGDEIVIDGGYGVF